MTIKLDPTGGGRVGKYLLLKDKIIAKPYAADNIVVSYPTGVVLYNAVYTDFVDSSDNTFADREAVLDYLQANFTDASSSGGVQPEDIFDGNGKIQVSLLPNSVMELQGEYNAATNTPTLVNGTGNSGDVWEVTTAGTVNFGDGAKTFAVGDWVVYAGDKWHKSPNTNPEVTWAQVTGKPTTVQGFGITNAVTQNNPYYIFEASRTADTVGDTRLRADTANNIYIESCSVANATKGGGTWSGSTTVRQAVISNPTSGNNSLISVSNTGVTISRNIADTNPALTVNNVQGTGNIIEIQKGGVVRARVDQNGNIYGTSFIQSGNTFTGASIPLYYTLGVFSTAAANNTTTYTTGSTIPGAWAQVRVNAATEPTVTGATKRTTKSDTFTPSTDMYMFVTYNGWRVEYWFETI